MPNEQLPSDAPEEGSRVVPSQALRERLRLQEQQLILMKETGPKSAAWQRARLLTLWRIQQRLQQLQDET